MAASPWRTVAAVASLVAVIVYASWVRPPVAVSAAPDATRLVHGPVLLRLTGYNHLPPSDGTGRWRYAIFFKLNRDPVTHPQQAGWFSTRGNYFLLGSYLGGFDSSFTRYGPKGSGCLGQIFAKGVDDTFIDAFDRIRTGASVPVKLRPLSFQPDGTTALGKTYVVKSTLRTADVAFKGSAAKAALRRIGCLKDAGDAIRLAERGPE